MPGHEDPVRRFVDASDVRRAVGEVIRPRAWLTIEQARVTAFAEATGDHQWIHTDPLRAAAGPFGTTVVHGYLVLALLPVFAANLYSFDFGSARVNYGCNKVRYPAPVRVNSRIRCAAIIVGCATKAAGDLVTVQFTVEIDGESKPAAVAETLTLIVP